jgi:ERCC4-type nuclease
MVIVRDTREKKPYDFDDHSIDTQNEKLDVGDYTIEGYEDTFAVERKTKSDFLRSITAERDRFEREIKRGQSLREPLVVVVESPYAHFKQGFYYADVHPNSVTGTVDSWGKKYDLDFWFMNGRGEAEESTYLQLIEWALLDQAGD